MEINATYKVELRLNGQLIGDVRKLAQNLKWARRRTMKGVDEITFTLNDRLFAEWCEERSTTINEMLRPLALDCRIVRNGVPLVGGFLATMPAYSPNGTSANLAMSFDGYLNYLAGVYIYPTPTVTERAGIMVSNWIKMAEQRSQSAGKAFGFVEGQVDAMASITQTFDGYKTVKEAIADRSDNVTGAGKFDVYFHPDRSYDIKSDANFGTVQDYIIQYPAQINGVSAASISADEVSGFASKVIALGAGETSANPAQSTVVKTEVSNSEAITTYGYAETLLQDSSVSRLDTLTTNARTQLQKSSRTRWEPAITLIGRQVAPTTSGEPRIWIGDTVTIQNDSDYTGSTSGQFRVQELEVSVSSTGAESIVPTLERVE